MVSLRKRYTAWVVFQGAEHRRFWRVFTRRGWRHCFVILPVFYPEPGLMADRYSLVINPTTDHVGSDVIFRPPADLAQDALREGATAVIKIPIAWDFSGAYVPRGVLTCVSLVKALLGLGAWYVWTPEHLARHLLRIGGKFVEIEHDDTFRRGAQGETGRQRAASAAPARADGEQAIDG